MWHIFRISRENTHTFVAQHEIEWEPACINVSLRQWQNNHTQPLFFILFFIFFIPLNGKCVFFYRYVQWSSSIVVSKSFHFIDNIKWMKSNNRVYYTHRITLKMYNKQYDGRLTSIHRECYYHVMCTTLQTIWAIEFGIITVLKHIVNFILYKQQKNNNKQQGERWMGRERGKKTTDRKKNIVYSSIHYEVIFRQ